MCGIVGVIGNDQERLTQMMLKTIAHRGPDGQAVREDAHGSLGHTRLAIIDIEGGTQPMCDPETENHIVYNGEIYNYRDLRRGLKGHRFRTRSDTEVLLHLAQSGQECAAWLRQLEGMFAFVLLTPQGLVAARDPLGIKPLYIGQKGNIRLFASEIKALLSVGGTNIREFPPGYVYAPDTGLQAYYRLRSGAPDVTHAETACQGVLRRLVRSVRASLTADVPVGVFLSGGLDSSLIAALAKRFTSTLHSFAVGTQDSLDLQYARQAAAFLQTRHHERLFTIQEAIEALPEVIYHLESFDCALVRSAIPNYFLARLASKQVKVTLSGEGADELFAGYEYLKALEGDALQYELLYITRRLHNTNLQRCDRMSMAHGLEARVPFLDDPDLVDYAFRLHPDLKMRGPQRIEKWILRRAANRLLPKDIVMRRKVKFAQGAGLGDLLARYAEQTISDSTFAREREIAENVFLRSKEELCYYRIFRKHFPAERLWRLIGRSRSV